MYKLYKVTNLITNKIYVGQTKRSLSDRFVGHCTQGYILTSSIKKHGRDNFSIELIEEVETLFEANCREIKLQHNEDILTKREVG